MNNPLKGSLVRLSAVDPEELGRAVARWASDSEYKRLLDADALRLRSTKASAKWFEKRIEEQSPKTYFFSIRTLAEDKLIGEMNLEVVNWAARDAFVGIGIGEREFWGKGYGTDALSILLCFAFTEVNLRRVTLTVFEYNPRAIRSYEKAGFRHEGRLRQLLYREGRRWDELHMGILREEWVKKYGCTP